MSCGISGATKKVHRFERGCEMIGPAGLPSFCIRIFTIAPNCAGTVIAPTLPAGTKIRPSSGSMRAGSPQTFR